MNHDEKKIVLARLQTMPENMNLFIDDLGTFDKWGLIENVEKETEVGELIVEVYMSSIRKFKEMAKS
ncbi:hypothetical protein A3K63_01605 [Candidatus Micrarchaeota archaeon RBG_16_49_10]|nr:MAG: hypothetical protein A3K63_01605 [Candidatus Micrarchaeota archaeon RBG_16_49_10]